jgi:two-component system sensor histidine kinase YesM
VFLEPLDEAHMAFYAPIPGSRDWFLCTVVDNSRLFQDTQVLTSSLTWLWLSMLIMGIGGAFFVSSRITRRVSQLSMAMEEVQKGNLETNLTISGKDEISQLARHFNLMVDKIKGLMNEVIVTQKEKRQRELQVLQAQINPHFIYNTLDTIQWKALEYGAEDLGDLILALSSFFRISLSKGEEKITLRKELDHVRSYLEIQHYRYSDILKYELDIEEELMEAKLPKIIIQPLVENAIYHGIKPKLTGGTIRISARRIHEDLIIEVEDDGVGMDEEKLMDLDSRIFSLKPQGSYGLYNVSERIRLYYGSEYGIRIRSSIGEGTSVTLRLPLEKGED